MRQLLLVIVCLSISFAHADEWEERKLFAGRAGVQTLQILSSTDLAVFEPIIEQFLAVHPNLNVEYLVASSFDIYDTFRNASAEYDVVISSAMDLQLKLVNDGYASKIDGLNHPEWAQWRQSVFGFTLEPAAIVINTEAFADLPIPRSRQEMIEVLRANSDRFRGRIGTYDIRESGLGYLFATQDARSSETYWRLMEIMGGLESRLYCCSGEMINDLHDGVIAIAYNVLGSYANARKNTATGIDVILPSDFPTTMMRTALVSSGSDRKEAATEFLRFLISASWVEQDSPLQGLDSAAGATRQSVIGLDPGLMIFLDGMKRRVFLNAWENAIIH